MEKNRKAVVFDMDGVIIDTEKMYLECWIEAGKARGLEGIENPAIASIGVNWEETKQLMVDYFGEDLPIDDLAKEFTKLAEKRFMENKVDLKPGICELLESLKKGGYRIGLASSSDRYLVEAILDAHKIGHYFEHLTCGDEIERSKPEPDIYLCACRDLQVDPADAVAIEDSFNGIRSARTAGMRPIMVPDLIQPDEEMQEKAEVILDDLFQVDLWLQAQN